MLAVVAAAAVWSEGQSPTGVLGIEPGVTGSKREPRTATPGSPAGPPVPAGGPLLVWPTNGQTAQWRNDVGGTVRAFSESVLGWRDATWMVAEVARDRTARVRLRDGGGSRVRLELLRAESPRTGDPQWGVTQVSLPGKPSAGLTVNIEAGRAWVASDWWPADVVEAEAVVSYGDDVVAATVGRPPAAFELTLPFATDVAGSVLIKFRNAGNSVVGAQGIGVPPGPFATTSS